MKIKMSNSAYCIRLFTIWRHTKKNLTAHLCVAAHRLRNTALDTRTRKVMMRTVTTAAVLSWLTNSPTFYEKLICTYILKFISFFQKKNSFFVKKVIQAASFFQELKKLAEKAAFKLLVKFDKGVNVANSYKQFFFVKKVIQGASFFTNTLILYILQKKIGSKKLLLKCL